MSATTSPSPEHKKAVLFGASGLGQYAASVLARDFDIVAFVDNDAGKWGGTFVGRPVRAPADLPELLADGTELIITSSYHGAIARQLRELGHRTFSRFTARHQVLTVEEGNPPEKVAAPADDFIQRINTVRTNFGETLRNIVRLGHLPATVIDVGVAFGTPELTTALPDGQLIMIEPLEEFRPHMEKIAANRPGARFLVAAAGRERGEMEMSVTPDKSTSSLRKFAGAERRLVPVVRVDELCREWNARPPYALKVDVQGAELVVLDGCSGILPETLVVILEVSMWGNQADVPDFFGTLAYMKERGFVAYDVVGGHNRPLDGARWQADVVFVRADGPLFADRRWCTPEQREQFLNAKRAKAAFREVMKPR